MHAWYPALVLPRCAPASGSTHRTVSSVSACKACRQNVCCVCVKDTVALGFSSVLAGCFAVLLTEQLIADCTLLLLFLELTRQSVFRIKHEFAFLLLLLQPPQLFLQLLVKLMGVLAADVTAVVVALLCSTAVSPLVATSASSGHPLSPPPLLLVIGAVANSEDGQIAFRHTVVTAVRRKGLVQILLVGVELLAVCTVASVSPPLSPVLLPNGGGGVASACA